MTTADADATRILGKGPEYLRKQMELESDTKGRSVSAVERLAASKPQYVRSQQVVNSTPVISFGAPSISSNSSDWSSDRSGGHVTGNTSRSEKQSGPITQLEVDITVRRRSFKKRDSLILHRQKCDLLRGSTGEKPKQILGRKLTSLVKANALPEATGKECETEDQHTSTTAAGGSAQELINNSKTHGLERCGRITLDVPTEQRVDNKECTGTAGGLAHNRVTEIKRSGKGVGRSRSDISSRYSKNFADFDAFFKYCGLDREIIETLGEDNFSAQSDKSANLIRSVSCSTSDGGFSQNSGDSDGLQQEELRETIRQETSVIERNARIIKWLYSCKNAQNSGKTLRDLE